MVNDRITPGAVMQVPSINIIGGALAVAALGAVIYFGAQATPTPTVSTVATAPATPVLKPPVVPAPAKVVKKRPTQKNCNWVPVIAKAHDKELVLTAAAQYGLSPAQLSALRACLN